MSSFNNKREVERERERKIPKIIHTCENRIILNNITKTTKIEKKKQTKQLNIFQNKTKK